MKSAKHNNFNEKSQRFLRKSQFPSWVEEDIDQHEEHFVLTYSEKRGKQGRKVGLLGRKKVFIYELLVLQFLTKNEEIRNLLRNSIEFFINLNEPKLWNYLKYHCGTLSNFYNKIHFQLSTVSFKEVYQVKGNKILLRRGYLFDSFQNEDQKQTTNDVVQSPDPNNNEELLSGGFGYEVQFVIKWNRPVKRCGADCVKCGKRTYWLFNIGCCTGMARAMFYCPECNYQFTRR